MSSRTLTETFLIHVVVLAATAPDVTEIVFDRILVEDAANTGTLCGG
jgi:hypothetical protein